MLEDDRQQRGDDEVWAENQEAEEYVEVGDGEHLQTPARANQLGQPKHLKGRLFIGIFEC